MKATIHSPQELLEFIATDVVTDAEAITLINSYLDVFYPKDISKQTLIRSVEYMLEFYGAGIEHPFFPDVI